PARGIVRSLGWPSRREAVGISLRLEQCQDILPVRLIEKDDVAAGRNFLHRTGSQHYFERRQTGLTSSFYLLQRLLAADTVKLGIQTIDLNALVDQGADHLRDIFIETLTRRDRIGNRLPFSDRRQTRFSEFIK